MEKFIPLSINGIDSSWEDHPLISESYNAMQQVMEQARSEIYKKIEDEIKKRLSQIGYNFNSNVEFYEFCKDRLTKHTISPHNESHLYLDYGKPSELLIATFYDNYKYEQEDNKFTVSWNVIS